MMKKQYIWAVAKTRLNYIKKALDYNYIERENKILVLTWANLVDTELSSEEKYDLEYAFMHNPEDYFSYPIKHMELHIKKINTFD
jgi:hypothetical protein